MITDYRPISQLHNIFSKSLSEPGSCQMIIDFYVINILSLTIQIIEIPCLQWIKIFCFLACI